VFVTTVALAKSSFKGLKVSVLAGRSESVADVETFSVASSLIVWSAGTVKTGVLFTSFTVTVKLFVTLNVGVPSSVTATATV